MRLRLLFLIVLIIEIYASTSGNQTLVYITKPLLMPILMYIAYKGGVKNKWLYLALLFSLGGDTFLMFEGTNYFLLGLSSFLLAHVFYIILFLPKYKFSLKPIVIYGLLAAGYLTFLYPHIPSEFKIPVIVYCAVIITMAIMSVSRSKSDSCILLLSGGVLFVVSDSLLAYNKFHSSLYNDALLVMSTYGAAQLLIVEGWIKQEDSV